MGEICPILDYFTDSSDSNFEARMQNCEELLLVSSCLPSVCTSVCLSAWNNSDLTVPIFIKFLGTLSKKIKFYETLTRIAGTLRHHLCTFMIISRSVLIRIRNITDKIYRENQNTYFMFNVLFS